MTCLISILLVQIGNRTDTDAHCGVLTEADILLGNVFNLPKSCGGSLSPFQDSLLELDSWRRSQYVKSIVAPRGSFFTEGQSIFVVLLVRISSLHFPSSYRASNILLREL